VSTLCRYRADDIETWLNSQPKGGGQGGRAA
jgi:hypothetical protein